MDRILFIRGMHKNSNTKVDCIKYGFADKIIDEPEEIDLGMKINGVEKKTELVLTDGDELVVNNCKFKIKVKNKDKKQSKNKD